GRWAAEIGERRPFPAGAEKDRLEDARIGRGSGGEPMDGAPFIDLRHPGGGRLAEAAHRPIGGMVRNRAAEYAVWPPMRLTRRLRPVIAEKTHHVGGGEATLARTEKMRRPAPALMPACKRRAFSIGEDVGKVESIAGLHESMFLCQRF